MGLSRIAQSVGESATLKLNELAAALVQRGEPVLHLGGGEPKSKAPAQALASAAALLATGEVRYAPPDGIPSLKRAILAYTEEFYGRLAAPENVMASGGAKQAIMVCLQAILNPGEEVVYPAPYWVSYPQMVSLVGGVGVPVHAADGGFVPRLRDIEQKVGPSTRAVILNSPNNPSGVLYPRDLVAEVVDLCERRGLWLIMDDIYHRLVFAGQKPVSSWELASDRSETSKLVLINGVSKQYAMTGFRIGWAVGSRALIAAMTKIQGQQTSGPSTLSTPAAVGALKEAHSDVESLRATLESNRDLMVEHLRSFNRVVVRPPDGTFYCFPDFGAYNKTSAELARFVLEKARVITVPGVEFGMDSHLRLSFCGSAGEIREGIDRMKWALDPGAPAEIEIGGRRLRRDWV